MLEIICGRASTGKTEAVMQAIEKDASVGKKAVLLVPEQFSFESERSVLNRLGDKNASMVEVYSFSSLADVLCATVGGSSKELLSDADKIVFMSKTLQALEDKLTIWKKYLHSVSFAERVVDIIGEFKVSAISAENIDKVSATLSGGALKSKIQALALIYRTYDVMLSNRFIDPADKLTLLFNNLKREKFFSGKTVYIDGFKGYTGQQYKIIEQILTTADALTVTAECDQLEKPVLNLFYNSRETVNRLIRIAEKHNIKAKTDTVLTNTYYKNDELKAVEEILCGKSNTTFAQVTENVNFCVAKSNADEAAFTARTIRRLVRENGYRYKDFVVIARNADVYETAIQREFEDNDVSCFFDKKTPLVNSPLFRLIEAAFDAVKGFASADIFRFLKTGLVDGFDDQQINDLENYVYLWNLSGKQWFDNWNMDPNGFEQEKIEKLEENNKTLLYINSLRKKALDILCDFKENLKGDVTQKTRAVIKLLDTCGASRKLIDFSLNLPTLITNEDLEVMRQSWDKVMNVFDGIVKCFGDNDFSLDEFIETFKMSCQMTTVGRIPQMLDEVTFGSAERIRPSRPKIAFILGANQGVFPALPTNGSILGNADRRVLSEAGLDIRNKTVYLSIEEKMLVYSSVCCASEKIYICCNEKSTDGNASLPSAFFEQLKNAFPLANCYKEPDEQLSIDNLPETEKSTFELLCNTYQKSIGTATLKAAIDSTEKYSKVFADSLSACTQKEKQLTKATAGALYGKSIATSATRFDVFHSCRFRYFCNYAIAAKKFRPAVLDVMQRGTLVHYVLEQFCNRHMQDIGSVTEDVIISETDEFTKQYLDLIRGSQVIMTARFRFLLKKIKEGIVDVLKRIVKEFSQSLFRPQHCEVSIGNDGVIPMVEFPFDGGKMKLYGSIDRLDTWGSFVRIIDYKTGSKTFKLSDTLYGQNMQMLMYLYAVVRGGNEKYNGMHPAGILYLPSKKDIENSGLAMNGMLCENLDVIEAMESANQGEFIPKYAVKKDGTPAKTNKSFMSAEAFNTVFDHIERLAKEMGEALLSGEVNADPLDGVSSDACKYCDFKAVCDIGEKPHRKIESLENGEVIRLMREDTAENEV